MSPQSQESRDHHGTSQAQKNAPYRAGSRSRTVRLNQLDTDRRALVVVRQRGSQGRTALTPVSVAGVARRTTRRAVVGGAAVGAAAVGTACVNRVLVNGVYVCR